MLKINENSNALDDSVGNVLGKLTGARDGINDASATMEQARAMAESVDEKVEKSKAVQQIDALTEEILNITDQTTLLAFIFEYAIEYK